MRTIDIGCHKKGPKWAGLPTTKQFDDAGPDKLMAGTLFFSESSFQRLGNMSCRASRKKADGVVHTEIFRKQGKESFFKKNKPLCVLHLYSIYVSARLNH